MNQRMNQKKNKEGKGGIQSNIDDELLGADVIIRTNYMPISVILYIAKFVNSCNIITSSIEQMQIISFYKKRNSFK